MWGWFVTVTGFVIHMVVVFLLKPIPSSDPEKRSIRLACWISWVGIHLIGCRIKVIGKENIPKGQPFIVVANHQSYLDIIVLMITIGQKIAFVAKEELLNRPILGWDIRTQGHIAINRAEGVKAMRQLKEIAKDIKKGKSILLFPEGTRSMTTEVGEFKRGAFQLAVDANVPVIACTVSGTGNCLPKNSFKLRAGKLCIQFHTPIDVSKLTGTDKEKTLFLAKHTRNLIIEGQHQILSK